MFSILYVDDEEALLEIGKLFLEQGGQFRVETITAATEALRLLEEKKFDAIISDYQMPEMDGIAFLKRVRTSGNTIPFILFTGKGREEVVIDAINSGADFYLQKGGDPVAQFTELAHKVRQSVQRRRAEADIRDLERRQSDIINFLPDPTFAIDTRGIVIAWNRAMEEMTGVPAGDVLGKGNAEHAFAFYHERRPMLADLVLKPDDPFESTKYIYTIHTGTTLTGESEVRRPDGTLIHIWGKATRLFDESGNLSGAIESLRDITDKRQGEAALRESETRFRELSDLLPQIVYEVDTEGNIRYTNRIAFELFGYTDDDFRQGLNVMQMLAPEERARAAAAFRAVVEGKSPAGVPGEYTALRKDGSTFHVSIYSSPVTVNGRITGIRGIIVDVTEGKKGEDELRAAYEQLSAADEELRSQYDELVRSERLIRESEENFQALVESAPDAIYISVGLKFAYVNPAMVRLMGATSAGQLIGMSLYDRVHPSFHAGIRERARVVIEERRPAGIEETVYLKMDGTPVHIESAVATFRYNNSFAGLVILRDITRRKEAEDALRESERRLNAMAANIPGVVYRFSVSPDGSYGFDYISGRSRQILGLENDPATFFDRIKEGTVPEERDRFLRSVRHAVSTKTLWQYDGWFVKPSGKKIWLSAVSNPVTEDDRLIFDGVIFDSTRWKQAEGALQESGEILRKSESRLSRAEEVGKSGNWEMRPDDGEFEGSAGTGLLYGLEGSVWKLEDVREIALPEYRPLLDAALKDLIAGRAPYNVEFKIRRKSDGAILDIHSVAEYDPERNVVFGVIHDITDRKKMEESLLAANKEYESLLDQMQDVYYRSDAEGILVRASRSLATLLGYADLAECLGRRADSFYFSPADRNLFLAEINRTGSVTDYESHLRRKDGSMVVVATRSHLCYDAAGNITGIEGTFRDITRRIQAEEALAESEVRYRSTLNAFTDAVSVVDREFTVILANSSLLAWLPALGQSGDIVGKRIMDAFPFLPPAVLDEYRTVFSTGTTLVTEESSHIGDAEIITETRKIPLTEHGEVVAVVAVIRDITDRRRAERALAESGERYRSILAASPDGVAITDAGGMVTMVSPAVLRIFGFGGEDEVRGRPITGFLVPEDRDRAAASIGLMHQGVFTGPGEYRALRTDGKSFDIEANAEIIRDAGGQASGMVFVVRDITERRQAGEALRRSEERYRSMVEASPDMIWEVDTRGNFTYISAQTAPCLGYAPEELIGKPFLRLVRPEAQESVMQTFRSDILDKTTFTTLEVAALRKDGSPVIIEVRSVMIADDTGQVAGFRGIARDITERRQTELALRESEEKYRRIVETTRDIIYTLNAGGEFTFVSPSVTRVLGYTPTDLTGRPLISIVHPDDVQKVRENFRRSMEGDYQSPGTEARVRHASGEWRWLITRGERVRDPDGNSPYFAGIANDITGRRQAEEELKKSEEKFRYLVEFGLEGVLVLDLQGTVLFANNAAARLVEYDDNAGLIGKNVMEFIAPESREEVARDFAEVARGHDSYLAEYTVISAKGRKISVESIGKIVSYEGKPADLISLRDISGRKRAEEALRQANRKLSLLSGITRHDITNQLTVLKGHLAFLEKRQPDTTYNASFKKIDDAANRILAMIRFTKEYEAIGVHAPAWQNCRSLAEAAARQAGPGKVRVENNLPATLEIFADPLIATVFYNLVENAIRYGGKITTIRFSAEGSEDRPVIICEDDGEGIPVAEKERIFERGFGKNTGLGLFLAREILAITEITIRETGVPGTGARFEIGLPANGCREQGEEKE